MTQLKRCLVTGGCGFLGSWIVRELLDEGCSVHILAVKGEPRDNVEGLDVEIIEGDVRSREIVERAVDGMDTVFHAAAVYQDFAPDPTLMYDVNLRGTFYVLEAARRAGVKRVVYTASMVSLGRPPIGQTADETTAYESWDIDFPYGRSKFFSREIAEYFAAFDQDVVVVCPGVVLGPGDIRPTPSGSLIVKSFQAGPALHFEGGATYVDVRDAAKVHVLAAKKGKKGERYLAVAHNLSNKELVETIQREAGTNKQLLKLPVPVARAVAQGMNLVARRTGTPPLLALEFFEYSLRPSYYRNDKARRELGAEFRPIEETIRDAITYFRGRGLIAA
jgi:dihydroflavonol-4-reductase